MVPTWICVENNHLKDNSYGYFPVLTSIFSLSVSQGRIACANVLSDLYAMGITECDNMLMLLSVSQKMNDKVTRVCVWTPRR